MGLDQNLEIELKGVKTHNLKIDKVGFPLGKMTVVTGVSGSGKSSLVFDTLYSESYRRYVENLSSFARQYLKAMPKPELEDCLNLPPSIAIKQHQALGGGLSNRSTVGSLTELTDYLRILFAHAGSIFCSHCSQEVRAWNSQDIVVELLKEFPERTVLVLAPLARYGKMMSKDLVQEFLAQGFSRVYVGGEILKLADQGELDFEAAFLVIDRIKVSPREKGRLFEAVQLGIKVGQTHLRVELDSKEASGIKNKEKMFTSSPICPKCQVEYLPPSVSLLSYNHPVGACETCQGFGQASELDFSKIIPDHEKTLADEGVAPWNFGQFREYYTWAKENLELSFRLEKQELKPNGRNKKQPLKLRKELFNTKFALYTEDEWAWLKEGGGKHFDGIMGFFRYLESKKYKPHYRIHLSRFRRYVQCPSCHGSRLNPKALAVKWYGLSIAEAHGLSLKDLKTWVEKSVKNKQESDSLRSSRESHLMGIEEALEETLSRLQVLMRLGLSYLSLDRLAKSLSGGELQRIHLGRCLGSTLEETLYCLDEPTAGLHPRDTEELSKVLRDLLGESNTLVLVEHDLSLIEKADYLVEIGPKAGAEGGQVVFQGKPSQWTPMLKTLKHRTRLVDRPKRLLHLEGASAHNLKNVAISIPVGELTVVCGVSGSGKTTLVEHCLYPALLKVLQGKQTQKSQIYEEQNGEELEGESSGEEIPAAGQEPLLKPLTFVKEHRDVLIVSQSNLSRNSRSNIATYLGIMDDLRKILAAEPLAKELRLGPGAFSFNSPGGRCETCKGLGLVTEDLSFLGEVDVRCPSCLGKRFSEKVLQVTYKGADLSRIFDLTVREARDFFKDKPSIRRLCDQVCSMGLGYLTLGQSTSSFSGGEAQRLKILSILSEENADDRPLFLIFDEPTRGLSRPDVLIFLEQLFELSNKGHTVLVIDHHLDMIVNADWLIEVGPEAALGGGQIVYMGEVGHFVQVGPLHSRTHPYLLKHLKLTGGSPS